MNDVVITGIGLVTPLGANTASTFSVWQAGACAPRSVLPDLAGTPLADAQVALPPEFDAAARLGKHRRMLKFMSGAAVLGCVAAREAVDAAGIAGRYAPERIGLYAGAGLAAVDLNEVRRLLVESVDEKGEFSCRRFGERGLPATNPLLSFKILANMPACLVSILECLRGPSLIFAPWEGEAAAALIEAWRAVASGEVDAAVTGAADTPAQTSTLAYLRQSGILKPDETAASSAAYLVFERAEAARAAGRRIHATLRDLRLAPPGLAGIDDPLAGSMGRCFASAPAILLALQALAGQGSGSLSGTDGQRFSFEIAGNGEGGL